MKVFISWSGAKSRYVAEVLRDWLPDVLQDVQPWMSKTDLEAGVRWNPALATELNTTKYGILCVTSENQVAPWLLFEAGALAKTLDNETFVCPYLIGLEPAEIQPGPLAQFQAKRATKEETAELLRGINRALGDKALPEDRLLRTFDRCWPDLETKLHSIPESERPPNSRSVEEMVAEVLELTRAIANRELGTRGANMDLWRSAELAQALAKYLDSPADMSPWLTTAPKPLTRHVGAGLGSALERVGRSVMEREASAARAETAVESSENAQDSDIDETNG